VEQKHLKGGEIDLDTFSDTETHRSAHEGFFQLTQDFIPVSLKNKLNIDLQKTFVVVDKFVFMFDRCSVL
jgi:hypothetical protein